MSRSSGSSGGCARAASAFDLGERGEELGADERGRIAAKERAVLRPRFRRRLRECAAQWKEQLRGLADDLINPVQRECCHDERREPDRESLARLHVVE